MRGCLVNVDITNLDISNNVEGLGDSDRTFLRKERRNEEAGTVVVTELFLIMHLDDKHTNLYRYIQTLLAVARLMGHIRLGEHK